MNCQLKQAACSLGARPSRVGHHDECPPTNVRSRDAVRRASETTSDTAKSVSVGAVALINTSAFRTLSRSVTRVNEDHRDTGKLRFVFDEASQLPEAPRMERTALRSSSPYPFLDALQL